jgi:hypothetical protein
MDIRDIARNMLQRYSSPRVAEEMAHGHACDYTPDSEAAKHWRAVQAEIRRQAHIAASKSEPRE